MNLFRFLCKDLLSCHLHKIQDLTLGATLLLLIFNKLLDMCFIIFLGVQLLNLQHSRVSQEDIPHTHTASCFFLWNHDSGTIDRLAENGDYQIYPDSIDTTFTA